MTIETYVAFVIVCVLLALTPGPAMSLILANSAKYGVRAGLMTVVGNTLGLGVLAAIASLGMNSMMIFVAEWFDWLRWIGAAYLIWLGASRIWCSLPGKAGDEAVIEGRRRGWFRQGLAVALSNPKVLLFLGALFPQFVDAQASAAAQFFLLSATFLASLTLVDLTYAFLADSVRGWLTEKTQHISDRVTGTLLIIGGVWLAAARWQ
jgi:threonine/homoserine/homoserine lactone efflux protein